MGQAGVSPVPAGMMVGRPGSQPGAGGQGPLGTSSSEFASKLPFDRYSIIFLPRKLIKFFFSAVGQIGKAPSAIKTNIKAASQIHPYGR